MISFYLLLSVTVAAVVVADCSIDQKLRFRKTIEIPLTASFNLIAPRHNSSKTTEIYTHVSKKAIDLFSNRIKLKKI